MLASNIQVVKSQGLPEVQSQKMKEPRSDSSFKDMLEAARTAEEKPAAEEQKVSYKKDNKSLNDKEDIPQNVSEKTAEETSVQNASFASAQAHTTPTDTKKNISIEDAAVSATEPLSEQDITYLKSSYVKDNIESLLTSAEEFNSQSVEQERLLVATQVSVDNPGQFLASLENSAEAQVQAAAVPEGTIGAALNMTGKSEGESFLNLAQSGEETKDGLSDSIPQKKKTEQKSLLNGLFSLTDERTVTVPESELEYDSGSMKISRAHSDSAGETSVNAVLNMPQDAAKNILSSDTQSAQASGSVFQQMVSQQIAASAPDFVKAGSIVLKDNNSGTINMALKPEALGNVKITLELSDKVVSGHITVASREAFEAFRQNLDTLKQAFVQSGFDNATFTLSIAQNNSQGGMFGGERQQSAEQFLSEKTYGDYAVHSNSGSAVSAGDQTSYEASADYRINVVA